MSVEYSDFTVKLHGTAFDVLFCQGYGMFVFLCSVYVEIRC